MLEGKLDVTSLENALKRLGEVITRYQNDMNDDAVRDSVIQRFEFTYSIALKTLRKFLIDRAFVVDDVNQMSFNDMIRTASGLNILKSDLEVWTMYREIRNMTSHTYDEKIALKVVKVIPQFYDEILFLLQNLKDKK